MPERAYPLVILPGSGVNATTIRPILAALIPHGLTEIHLSGSSSVEGAMTFRRNGFGMGVGGDYDWGVLQVQSSVIKAVSEAIHLP